MHELTIVQSLIEAATAEAARANAVRIRRMNVRIGFLRQIDESLLQEAFGIARGETLAATAELNVAGVGMTLSCRSCGRETQVADWSFACPVCRSTAIRLNGGDELELVSIEVETADEHPGAEKEPLPKQRAGRRRQPSPAR